MYICQLKIDGARGMYGGEGKQDTEARRGNQKERYRLESPKMRGIC